MDPVSPVQVADVLEHDVQVMTNTHLAALLA